MAGVSTGNEYPTSAVDGNLLESLSTQFQNPGSGAWFSAMLTRAKKMVNDDRTLCSDKWTCRVFYWTSSSSISFKDKRRKWYVAELYKLLNRAAEPDMTTLDSGATD